MVSLGSTDNGESARNGASAINGLASHDWSLVCQGNMYTVNYITA